MKHLPRTPQLPLAFGASLDELERLAKDLRYQVVQMSHQAGTPHLGSALSCIDLLAALYWRAVQIDPRAPQDPSRDRLILSKGHAAAALYSCLSALGAFPESWLDQFGSHRARLAEQPAPNCAPGVEWATGSLGHGLPVGIGMAMAARLQKRGSRVFVVMSDGECNEGSVWEAAMFAAAQKLGRLMVLIDYNKWQATGRSDEVMALPSLVQKWKAFGWNAHELDGHSLGDICNAIESELPEVGPPTALIAHTVKGKGVSFMEDDNNWHYRIPTQAEVEAAAAELS